MSPYSSNVWSHANTANTRLPAQISKLVQLGAQPGALKKLRFDKRFPGLRAKKEPIKKRLFHPLSRCSMLYPSNSFTIIAVSFRIGRSRSSTCKVRVYHIEIVSCKHRCIYMHIPVQEEARLDMTNAEPKSLSPNPLHWVASWNCMPRRQAQAFSEFLQLPRSNRPLLHPLWTCWDIILKTIHAWEKQLIQFPKTCQSGIRNQTSQQTVRGLWTPGNSKHSPALAPCMLLTYSLPKASIRRPTKRTPLYFSNLLPLKSSEYAPTNFIKSYHFSPQKINSRETWGSLKPLVCWLLFWTSEIHTEINPQTIPRYSTNAFQMLCAHRIQFVLAHIKHLFTKGSRMLDPRQLGGEESQTSINHLGSLGLLQNIRIIRTIQKSIEIIIIYWPNQWHPVTFGKSVFQDEG